MERRCGEPRRVRDPFPGSGAPRGVRTLTPRAPISSPGTGRARLSVAGHSLLVFRIAMLRRVPFTLSTARFIAHVRPLDPDVLQHVAVAVTTEDDFRLRRRPRRLRIVCL